MKLVVGLGNPGVKYEQTKHNVGFNALKVICESYNINSFQDKFDGKISKTRILGQEVIFFMPMSFMNNSGIPVNRIVKFYKISLKNIFIIFDDLDLSIGRIKIKVGGSSAGHNGLKSINAYIENHYNKIKIGIGRPSCNNIVASYVLSNFKANELVTIKEIYNFLSNNLSLILDDRKNKFLNLYYSSLDIA